MTGAPLGEIIYAAVKPMVRMYMIIGTGFFLTRMGLFGVTAARACSDMVLMLFMPALVFDKVVSYISISDIKTIGVICFCAFIMYSINACIAVLIVKFTPIPKDPKNRWVGGALLAGIMQNVSDLPISYIQAVSLFTADEQNKGTAYVIIWLAMYVITQFNCGLFQLVDWDFKYTDEHYNNVKDNEKDLENNNDNNNNNIGNDNSNDNDNNTESSSISNSDTTSSMLNTKENQHDNHDLHSEVTEPSTFPEINRIQTSNSENPVSPTSSIMSDSGSNIIINNNNNNNNNNNTVNKLKSSNTLDPKPLTKISSRLSQLNRSVSRLSQLSRTASRANAIARIPSARSMFTSRPRSKKRKIDENMNDDSSMNSIDSNLDNNNNNNDDDDDDDDDETSDNDDTDDDNDADDVISLNQELIREYSRKEPFNRNMSRTMKIITETNLSMKDVKDSGKSNSFIKKYHLNFLVFFLQNFKKPNSISICVSITLALIPWTKALFVNTDDVTLPNAPDKEPALSFILMYAEYLGYPCVPLGLLLVGSVLARLEFTDLPKGLWKSAVCHTIFRLGILPIIGTALITKFKNINWLTDPMAMFVCSMEFALPSATVQIYLTAGAMRPGQKSCSPMNCFGLYLALQYVVLVIAMPIVVCFCLKKTMDM